MAAVNDSLGAHGGPLREVAAPQGGTSEPVRGGRPDRSVRLVPPR